MNKFTVLLQGSVNTDMSFTWYDSEVQALQFADFVNRNRPDVKIIIEELEVKRTYTYEAQDAKQEDLFDEKFHKELNLQKFKRS